VGVFCACTESDICPSHRFPVPCTPHPFPPLHRCCCSRRCHRPLVYNIHWIHPAPVLASAGCSEASSLATEAALPSSLHHLLLISSPPGSRAHLPFPSLRHLLLRPRSPTPDRIPIWSKPGQRLLTAHPHRGVQRGTCPRIRPPRPPAPRSKLGGTNSRSHNGQRSRRPHQHHGSLVRSRVMM
jgi:hypothetical protein